MRPIISRRLIVGMMALSLAIAASAAPLASKPDGPKNNNNELKQKVAPESGEHQLKDVFEKKKRSIRDVGQEEEEEDVLPAERFYGGDGEEDATETETLKSNVVPLTALQQPFDGVDDADSDLSAEVPDSKEVTEAAIQTDQERQQNKNKVDIKTDAKQGVKEEPSIASKSASKDALAAPVPNKSSAATNGDSKSGSTKNKEKDAKKIAKRSSKAKLASLQRHVSAVRRRRDVDSEEPVSDQELEDLAVLVDALKRINNNDNRDEDSDDDADDYESDGGDDESSRYAYEIVPAAEDLNRIAYEIADRGSQDDGEEDAEEEDGNDRGVEADGDDDEDDDTQQGISADQASLLADMLSKENEAARNYYARERRAGRPYSNYQRFNNGRGYYRRFGRSYGGGDESLDDISPAGEFSDDNDGERIANEADDDADQELAEPPRLSDEDEDIVVIPLRDTGSEDNDDDGDDDEIEAEAALIDRAELEDRIHRLAMLLADRQLELELKKKK